MSSRSTTATLPPPASRLDAGAGTTARPLPERGKMRAPGATARNQAAPRPGGGDAVPGGASPSRAAVEPVAAEVAERFLAPALRAAAAARARSARIRAASETSPAPTRPRPPASAPRLRLRRPRRAPRPAAPPPTPAAPVTATMVSAPEPAAVASRLAEQSPPPPALRAPAAVRRDAGWSVSGKPADAPAGGRFHGLSVAAAARASTIAFRPLRRPAAAAWPEPDELVLTKAAEVPPAPAARRALPAAPPAAAAPVAPSRPELLVPPPGPPRRPRLEPTQQQRFAKTIAELQRYQAASREPGADLVPRPTLPPEDEGASGAWSWLWSRRKASDAG